MHINTIAPQARLDSTTAETTRDVEITEEQIVGFFDSNPAAVFAPATIEWLADLEQSDFNAFTRIAKAARHAGLKTRLEKEIKKLRRNASRSFGDWRDELTQNRNGIKPVLQNAYIALTSAPEWAGKIAFDDFAQRTVVTTDTGATRNWTDTDDLQITIWLQSQGIDVGRDVAAQAVEAAARANACDPVRDYLRKLTWDDIPRVGNWLVRYYGVEDTAYARAVGQAWLISAVARVMDPGCKVDTMLILEGAQGQRKSQSLNVLASDAWFTDRLSDVGSKDSMAELAGRWIVEIAELDAMGKSEAETIKAFLTSQIDRYRPAYARRVAEVPRRCVFAGTTNRNDWGKDATGGRRFWPVEVTSIDIEGLRADRDQLWAEAVALYDAGNKWWFGESDAVLADIRAQQEMRREKDVWEDVIAEHIAQLDRVSASDIATRALGLDVGRVSQRETRRIGNCLLTLDWEKARSAGERYYVPGPRVLAARQAADDIAADKIVETLIIRAAGGVSEIKRFGGDRAKAREWALTPTSVCDGRSPARALAYGKISLAELQTMV